MGVFLYLHLILILSQAFIVANVSNCVAYFKYAAILQLLGFRVLLKATKSLPGSKLIIEIPVGRSHVFKYELSV